MGKYQYRQVETLFELGSDDFRENLDSLGKEGWELVSVIPHQKPRVFTSYNEVTYLILIKRLRD